MSQTEAEKLADERKKRLIKYFTEPPDPRDQTFAIAFLVAAVCVAICAWGIFHLLEYRIAALAVWILAFFVATTGLDKLIRYRVQIGRASCRERVCT